MGSNGGAHAPVHGCGAEATRGAWRRRAVICPWWLSGHNTVAHIEGKGTALSTRNQHIDRIRGALGGSVPVGGEPYINRVAEAYARRDAEFADHLRDIAAEVGVARRRTEDFLREVGLVVDPEPQTAGSDFNGNGGVGEDRLARIEQAVQSQGQQIERLTSLARQHLGSV